MFFWGEIVNTVIHLLNRAPTKSHQGKTPYEAWSNIKPQVYHLRIFMCVVHVKKHSGSLKKLEGRSTPMVFIGCERGMKGYRDMIKKMDPYTSPKLLFLRRRKARIG